MWCLTYEPNTKQSYIFLFDFKMVIKLCKQENWYAYNWNVQFIFLTTLQKCVVIFKSFLFYIIFIVIFMRFGNHIFSNPMTVSNNVGILVFILCMRQNDGRVEWSSINHWYEYLMKITHIVSDTPTQSINVTQCRSIASKVNCYLYCLPL